MRDNTCVFFVSSISHELFVMCQMLESDCLLAFVDTTMLILLRSMMLMLKGFNVNTILPYVKTIVLWTWCLNGTQAVVVLWPLPTNFGTTVATVLEQWGQ